MYRFWEWRAIDNQVGNKWEELMGYDWLTDWIIEADKEEFIDLACLNLGTEERKKMKTTWEERRVVCRIKRWDWISTQRKLGVGQSVAVKKWLTQFMIELTWWARDDRFRVRPWMERDRSVSYWAKHSRHRDEWTGFVEHNGRGGSRRRWRWPE